MKCPTSINLKRSLCATFKHISPSHVRTSGHGLNPERICWLLEDSSFVYSRKLYFYCPRTHPDNDFGSFEINFSFEVPLLASAPKSHRPSAWDLCRLNRTNIYFRIYIGKIFLRNRALLVLSFLRIFTDEQIRWTCFAWDHNVIMYTQADGVQIADLLHPISSISMDSFLCLQSYFLKIVFFFSLYIVQFIFQWIQQMS